MPYLARDIDQRLDAAESDISAVQNDVSELQSASSMQNSALLEIRAKYEGHAHGLLGLGGTPLLPEGDLTFLLPGE